jgi:hypothetical protein
MIRGDTSDLLVVVDGRKRRSTAHYVMTTRLEEDSGCCQCPVSTDAHNEIRWDVVGNKCHRVAE